MASLQSRRRDPMTPTFRGVGLRYVKWKQSALRPFSPMISALKQFSHRELKRESYGLELLHTIGFVYVSKAKHHLATNQSFFGMGGWLHNVQGKYHVFSET